MAAAYRFHSAARDAYLDLLREATRKDCNTPDEDGMTPTLWAAYHGNLDALRLLVGRGGEPDKCDHYGNTAIHWAAANGHLNCVSFLVNFGVNLWALDNDFHTAKERAGIREKQEILRFLDNAMSQQSNLNKKLVAERKEKAVAKAEKRVKEYEKIQRQAAKRSEEEEKRRLKERHKMEKGMQQTQTQVDGSTIKDISGIASLRRDSRMLYSQPTRYSDIVNTGTARKKTFWGGTKRALANKKNKEDAELAFKISTGDGKRSTRSLNIGLRRDSEVLLVPNNKLEEVEGSHNRRLQDVFSSKQELTRAFSEPEFMTVGEVEPNGGLLTRHGFGRIDVSNSISGTLKSIPRTSSKEDMDEEDFTPHESGHGGSTGNGSIGSASSLEQGGGNSQAMPWQEEDIGLDDDEDYDESHSNPLVTFLLAHGLADHLTTFVEEQIDLDALMLLTDKDLQELGLQLGPRRKLLKAIDDRRLAMDDPGEVVDSKL